MAEEKESTSVPLSQAADPEDPAKSTPASPNSSTRKACCGVLQSWVSKKFMTGCVVLFPVAVTFFITWWFIQFVDGFFSPLYAQLGVNIFGLGFLTSLIFVFLMGIFVSSWLGSTVFWIGEWFIKRMPFVKHIYSASKQISTAISPDQNNTAFKEVAIIRHPRVGEYAFGFITSSVVLQTISPPMNAAVDRRLPPTSTCHLSDAAFLPPSDMETLRRACILNDGSATAANFYSDFNNENWDCDRDFPRSLVRRLLIEEEFQFEATS